VDLFEYQGKQFFAGFDIPVSAGEAVTTVDDAVAAAERLGYPVVVKAQVQVGGRGKAGGIKLANDADEVRTHASNILGMDIKGHIVEVLWIEVASDIAEEYYASFTLDRSAKKHLGMLSAQGGVEIEAVAEKDPDAIAKIWIDPVDGLTEEVAREISAEDFTRIFTSAPSPWQPLPSARISKHRSSGCLSSPHLPDRSTEPHTAICARCSTTLRPHRTCRAHSASQPPSTR